MNASSRVVALLLSGGAGTRLWPVSRAACPKQFLKLFGDLSLYQLTLKRLRASGVRDVIVAANRDHRELLLQQAQECGEDAPLLLLEPARRDSGPAIAAGVAFARKIHGDEAVVCAMPCDHLIPDLQAFSATLANAVQSARAGYLSTFGIAPSFPSTEFGYLQQGRRIDGLSDTFVVEKFHEKPDQVRAVAYLASGAYFWNSGMFVFSAGTFAAEASAHMPDVWTAVSAAVDGSTKTGQVVALAEEPFLSSPRISIDYALFERSSKVAMVKSGFAWSDVGNWSAVYDSLARDPADNALTGSARLRDCRSTLVVADDIPVVAIGVSDLVIIARPEGVFVAPRSRSAEVKAMIES